VRHNLSSSRAFLKGDRCGGERGKGFFWSVDENFAQTLEEQELKAQQAAAAAAQGLNVETKSKKKDKGLLLEPPLKRSIKGDTKGAPLPPPLTSSPLVFKATSTATSSKDGQINRLPSSTIPTTGVFPYPSHSGHSTTKQTGSHSAGYSELSTNGPNPYASLTHSGWALHANVASTVPVSGSSLSIPGETTVATHPPAATPAATTVSANQPAVPDVTIPIVIGPIPPTHPDYVSGSPNHSAKEGYMVLHERKLILDPSVFGELTKEMLDQLEKMGAPTALQILTMHMIRVLKERRARERGKDRAARKPKGNGPARRAAVVTSGPFTKVPLDETRKAVDGNTENKPLDIGSPGQTFAEPNEPTKAASLSLSPSALPEPILGSVDAPLAPESVPADPGSPIIDIDGDSEDEGPAAKKRKMEGGLIMTSV
jgi:forkhead box protein K